MSDVTYGEKASGWTGWIGFAAIMMMISGSLNALYGLIAALNDEWVVFGNKADLYLDVSQWGWVHIVIGSRTVLAGVGLFSGNVLARTLGVLMAAASVLGNFFWLPAYPIWSIIVITVDVLVIWALTAHGRDFQV